mgnify:CR=1 FL=1
MKPWDWWFYAEKVRESKFNYSEEEMRPYLSLENIQKAAFAVAERLFEIIFVPLNNYPKYHEDVKAYKVLNKSKKNCECFVVFVAVDEKGNKTVIK